MSCRHCGRRVEPGEGVTDTQLDFAGKTGEVHELCERFRDLEERTAARDTLLLAKIEQLSAHIKKLAAAMAGGRYSTKPSAVRMRRARRAGEFAARHTCDASRSEKAVTSVTARPLVVRSVTAQNETKKSYAASAPIPKISFVRLHHHFGALRLKLTGQSWYAYGEIPREEQRHATALLRATASITEALHVVDRFASLWRDTAKGKLQFSYRHVMFTKDRIEKRKGRLWFNWPKKAGSQRNGSASIAGGDSASPRPANTKMRAAAPVIPEPRPLPIVKRSMPDGPAQVQKILAQLAAKGVRAAAAR